MEFSKKAFIAIYAHAMAITLFSCVLMWHTSDTSALAYLIPAAFTELATATGFYFYKAKRENEIKLKQKYGQWAGENEEETL